MTLVNGIDLDQYKTQAKELLKAARMADPQAIERIRSHHPEHDSLIASNHIRLADAQLVIARENGYKSWAKMKEDILFQNAVQAVDTGDIPRLSKLLDKHPELLKYRCHTGEWYESGYFAGAMLIHHVAGNPIRHPLPKNIVEVTRLLLARGADPNAKTKGNHTTIGLVLTGKQPSDDRVALPLVDLLIAAGAKDDLAEPDILSGPLLNAAPATAEALVQGGAKVDLRHAAALGRLDLLEPLISAASWEDKESAMIYACFRNQLDSVRALLTHGATGDRLVQAHDGLIPRTALHEAANRGHREIVQLLLDNGADSTVVEPHWGGTAAGWAHHGGHDEIAKLLQRYGASQSQGEPRA
jgi:ankyrin repeat protein